MGFCTTRRRPADGTVELFDLANDPYEKNDLSAQRPEKVKELRQRYDTLAKQATRPKNAKE